MGEQLADGDPLLAPLGELRPVRADPLVEVEPPARVGEGERSSRPALWSWRRPAPSCHRDHGAPVAASRTPPHRSTTGSRVLVDAARRAELAAADQVFHERVPDGLEAHVNMAMNLKLSRPHSRTFARRMHSPRRGAPTSSCVMLGAAMSLAC